MYIYIYYIYIFIYIYISLSGRSFLIACNVLYPRAC